MDKPALPAVAADKGSSSTPRNVPISLRRGAARRSPGSGASPAAPSRPLPKGPVAIAAGSPLTVAGAAPVFHRTSLSRRRSTLARPPVYCQGASIPSTQSAGRAVHGADAPAMPQAGPVDMVDASDRAFFHRQGEAGFRFEVEREAERGADRAAMRDGDDVMP